LPTASPLSCFWWSASCNTQRHPDTTKSHGGERTPWGERWSCCFFCSSATTVFWRSSCCWVGIALSDDAGGKWVHLGWRSLMLVATSLRTRQFWFLLTWVGGGDCCCRPAKQRRPAWGFLCWICVLIEGGGGVAIAAADLLPWLFFVCQSSLIFWRQQRSALRSPLAPWKHWVEACHCCVLQNLLMTNQHWEANLSTSLDDAPLSVSLSFTSLLLLECYFCPFLGFWASQHFFCLSVSPSQVWDLVCIIAESDAWGLGVTNSC
jgi:hypothetical protein